MRRGLCLWFAARDAKTPLWARSTLLGAIGYFLWPLDVIPELIMPVIGYSEDVGIMLLALMTVAYYVSDVHRKQADAVLNRWFGPPMGQHTIDVSSTAVDSQ